MHPYVHCKAIYNNQDLKADQVPTNRWVDKKVVVHLHKGKLLSHEKEGNLTFCKSMDGPGEYYAKWSKPVKERHVPHDFTYIWNLMEKNKLTKGDILLGTQNRLTAARGEGIGGWVRRVKGLNKEKKTDSRT